MLFVEVCARAIRLWEVVLAMHLPLVVELDCATIVQLLLGEKDVLTSMKYVMEVSCPWGHNMRFNFDIFDNSYCWLDAFSNRLCLLVEAYLAALSVYLFDAFSI